MQHIRNTYTIHTAYDPPPIPDRNHDWSAWVGELDEETTVGWGSSESEAITDLLGWLDVE